MSIPMMFCPFADGHYSGLDCGEWKPLKQYNYNYCDNAFWGKLHGDINQLYYCADGVVDIGLYDDHPVDRLVILLSSLETRLKTAHPLILIRLSFCCGLYSAHWQGDITSSFQFTCG